MTELDPHDLRWAEDFGAHWGATYCRPEGSVEAISRALTEAANDSLNRRAIAHQKRLLRVPEHVELPEGAAAAASDYLIALAEVVLREAQWALWWRRQKLERGEPDPGSGYLTLRAESPFRTYLERVGPTTSGQVSLTAEAGPENKNTPKRRGIKIGRLKRAERKQAKHDRVSLRREELSRPADLTPRASDAERKRERQERKEEIRRRRPPAPAPQPYGVNHQGAERLVADWMRHLGVSDAVVTQYSGDGGVDVESRHLVAQVKNLHPRATVPISHIRDLLGTATHRKKGAALFTSGSVSQNGLKFANETGMALLHYNAESGTLSGLNHKGRRALVSGFPVAFGFDEF